jgi:hypothetical protein
MPGKSTRSLSDGAAIWSDLGDAVAADQHGPARMSGAVSGEESVGLQQKRMLGSVGRAQQQRGCHAKKLQDSHAFSLPTPYILMRSATRGVCHVRPYPQIRPA